MLKTAAAILLTVSPAFAQSVDWAALGAAAKGVGGAGVAFSEGTGGNYWNPAALAVKGEEGKDASPFSFSGFGFSLSGSGDIALEGDTMAVVDRIHDLYSGLSVLQSQQNLNGGTGTQADLQAIFQILDTMRFLQESDTGAIVSAGAALEIRFGSFGFFHRAIGNAGIDPKFDFTGGIHLASVNGNQLYSQMTGGALSAAGTQLRDNLVAAGFNGAQNDDADGFADADELAFQAQTALGDAAISDPGFQSLFIQSAIATNSAAGTAGDTLAFNHSGIDVNGILLRETGGTVAVPISSLLALPVPIPFLSTINAGISLKEVTGETFYLHEDMQNLGTGKNMLDDLLKQYKENRKVTNRFSADLGINGEPFPGITAGLSVKNIIPMKFDSAGPDDIEIGPQVRGGVKFQPLGLPLAIGLDLDLLQNDLGQFVDGLKSRQLASGLQLSLGFITFRGGYFDNVASKESGGTFSAGVGFKIPIIGLHADFDAQMSPGKSQVEVNSLFPNYDDGGNLKVPERVAFSFSAGLDLGF